MADTYATIAVQRSGPSAVLCLNRPAKRNAFDGTMVRELRQALRAAYDDTGVRVVVVTGSGKSFCSGVDLEWFAAGKRVESDQNLSECLELAALFREIYSGPKPVVAAINGPAMGGGIGFVAAADIAIAVQSAVFSLSATQIGVVPTCVAPYLIKRCGESHCRALMLTSDHLDARQAHAIGLIHRYVDESDLETAIDEVVRKLVRGGPEASTLCKRMIAELADLPIDRATRSSAEMLARLRRSDEAAAGIEAFLHKRNPAWWPQQE